MVWKCFQLKWVGWADVEDGFAGNGEVKKSATRVSSFGESRKDGKNQAGVAHGQRDDNHAEEDHGHITKAAAQCELQLCV